jgi:hypothetical protein
MNDSSKHQNDVKGRNIKSQHMNLLGHGPAYFRLLTVKRKSTNQNEPFIFPLRYDVVVQTGRPIACLECIILPH